MRNSRANEMPVTDFKKELEIRKISQILRVWSLEQVSFLLESFEAFPGKVQREQSDFDKLVEILRDSDEAFITSLLNQFRILESKRVCRSMFPRIAATT